MIQGSPIPISPTGRLFPHPYIVRTPPYARQSAGIRVLHWFCDALNRLGARAWVDVSLEHGAPGADPAGGEKAGLLAPPLTPQDRAALAAAAARPIVIHPEVLDDVAAGPLNVRYALNYTGMMGGARDLEPCDLTIAYSEAIRRKTPGCDGVLFIPGSDCRWWTPPPPSSNPSAQRRRPLIYSGKYIEYHRQRFPLHLRDCVPIHRHGPDAPSPEALRELLRHGARLYVFENTAMAAEAALCGCPVVVCRNWFFPELIAEHELGLDGFTYDDDGASLAAAQASLPGFHASYEAALAQAGPAMIKFVETTQRLAAKT